MTVYVNPNTEGSLVHFKSRYEHYIGGLAAYLDRKLGGGNREIIFNSPFQRCRCLTRVSRSATFSTLRIWPRDTCICIIFGQLRHGA